MTRKELKKEYKVKKKALKKKYKEYLQKVLTNL